RDPKKANDKRPWGTRTAHRKRSSLAGFYEWAVREELVERDPTATIELRRITRETPVRIPKSEVEQIFQYIENKIVLSEERTAQLYVLDAAIFRLCYNLALRVSEASHLQ